MSEGSVYHAVKRWMIEHPRMRPSPQEIASTLRDTPMFHRHANLEGAIRTAIRTIEKERRDA